MSAPRSRKVWVLTAVGYVVFVVLVWLLGGWLALRGGNLWLLRVGLWLLGLGAAGVLGWFFAGGEAQGESRPAAGGAELDTTLAAAGPPPSAGGGAPAAVVGR